MTLPAIGGLLFDFLNLRFYYALDAIMDKGVSKIERLEGQSGSLKLIDVRDVCRGIRWSEMLPAVVPNHNL